MYVTIHANRDERPSSEGQQGGLNRLVPDEMG